MELSAMAGAAVMLQAAQTRDNAMISLVRMANDQQLQIAEMIARNVQSGDAAQTGFNFSVYA